MIGNGMSIPKLSLDVADPSDVSICAVYRETEEFTVELPKFRISFCEANEFCGADWREVGWV